MMAWIPLVPASGFPYESFYTFVVGYGVVLLIFVWWLYKGKDDD